MASHDAASRVISKVPVSAKIIMLIPRVTGELAIRIDKGMVRVNAVMA